MRAQAAHEKEVPGFQEHSALLALKPGKAHLPHDVKNRGGNPSKQQVCSCTKLQHPSISPCSPTPEVAVAGNKHLLLPRLWLCSLQAQTPTKATALCNGHVPPVQTLCHLTLPPNYSTHSSQGHFERMLWSMQSN